MGKAFETKNDILQRLTTKKRTVSELSRELGLSKATVSQHLKELTDAGRVVEEKNAHFKRTKYFRIREHDYSTMKYAARYIIIAVIAAAVLAYGALALMHNGSNISPLPTTTNTVPQTTVSQPSVATDCIMLPAYNTANYSSINTVVSNLAHGSYCYLSYINLTSHTMNIGKGVRYTSVNGTLDVSSISYVYIMNSTEMTNLENAYSKGYCLAGRVLQFFGIVYAKKNATCKAVIY